MFGMAGIRRRMRAVDTMTGGELAELIRANIERLDVALAPTTVLQWIACCERWGPRSAGSTGCLLELVTDAWGAATWSREEWRHRDGRRTVQWTARIDGDAPAVFNGYDDAAALAAALDGAQRDPARSNV